MDAVQMFDPSQGGAEEQGLDGALRRRGRTAILVLATVLGASSAQGCCDSAVATTMSSVGESSSMSEGGSTESTGGPVLPEWAIGIFSSESDKVGMSFSNNPYWWSNTGITAEGALHYDLYGCSGLIERQEFSWVLGDDGRSLDIETIPPTDVFTWANGNQVSEVVIEPGDSCDTIVIHTFLVDEMRWQVSERQRGNVCARVTGAEGCTFTFEWCDGEPPAPCE